MRRRRRLLTSLVTAAIIAAGALTTTAFIAHHDSTTIPDPSQDATPDPEADATPPDQPQLSPTPMPEMDDEASPGATPAPTAPATGPHVILPILLYHYIRTNPERPGRPGWQLSVSPEQFDRQMAYLQAAGAHTLTMGELMTDLTTGRPLPPHPVALTFDDGYADFATAAEPILEHHGLVATDYVVTGFIGKPNYMSEDQVRDMAGRGMTIGAHTVHHVDLTRLHPAIAAYEIQQSKLGLEQLLRAPVDDFAYPYGGRNPAVERLVAAAGFRDAVTTVPGNVQYLSQRLELHRIRVGPLDTVSSVAHKALLPPPPPSLDVTPTPSPGVTPGASSNGPYPPPTSTVLAIPAPPGTPRPTSPTPQPGLPALRPI